MEGVRGVAGSEVVFSYTQYKTSTASWPIQPDFSAHSRGSGQTAGGGRITSLNL